MRHCCGPCHRAAGYRRPLPEAAIPSRPDLDTAGGYHAYCDGPDDDHVHGLVHLDHHGEPMTPNAVAAYRATLTAWAESPAGHSLLTMAIPKP